MDGVDEHPIVVELRQSFREARDVTPEGGQPLYVLLPAVDLAGPWHPSPARILLRFPGWPDQRPDFFIDHAVVNAVGEPPRSNSDQLVLGETWRQFSYGFAWPPASAPTATKAVLAWLARFREAF